MLPLCHSDSFTLIQMIEDLNQCDTSNGAMVLNTYNPINGSSQILALLIREMVDFICLP